MKSAFFLICTVLHMFYCVSVLTDVLFVYDEEKGEPCFDEENKSGICMHINRCSNALEDLKKSKFPKICSFERTTPIVCCTNSNSSVESAFRNVSLTQSHGFNKTDNSCANGKTNNGLCKPKEPSVEISKNQTKICEFNNKTSTTCTNFDSRNNLKKTEGVPGEISKANSSCANGTTEDGLCKPKDPPIEILKNQTKICQFDNKTSSICDNKPNLEKFTVPGEISKAKCKEYAKYSYRNITSPLLSTKPQYEVIYECADHAEILTIYEAFATEYPHMAHIGFQRSNQSIKYLCGGSLISESFVLTVGNCNFNIDWGYATTVRFGMPNISDSDNSQHRKIAKWFVHPDYLPSKSTNNIALLKLERPVDINHIVRPACLSTIENSDFYKSAVITGWGEIDTYNGKFESNLLKRMVFLSSRFCEEAMKENLIICAQRDIISQRFGSYYPCKGMEGSPLQVRLYNTEELQCMYSIIGVTINLEECITEPKTIFTHVARYIGWIEKIVWPELVQGAS